MTKQPNERARARGGDVPVKQSAADLEGASPRASEALVPWSSDEHKLAVESAKEAGLDARDAAIESFVKGFRAGLTLNDPVDSAIVLRGRTVLREKELLSLLEPTFRFLRLDDDAARVLVQDGTFELRIRGGVAEMANATWDSTKVAAQLQLSVIVLGLIALQWSFPFALGAWGIGTALTFYVWRSGAVDGRSLLAARLTLALALAAKEEGVVLPPRA